MLIRAVDKAKLIARIEQEYDAWGEEYDAMQILSDIEDMPDIIVEVEDDQPDEEDDKLFRADLYGNIEGE